MDDRGQSAAFECCSTASLFARYASGCIAQQVMAHRCIGAQSVLIMQQHMQCAYLNTAALTLGVCSSGGFCVWFRDERGAQIEFVATAKCSAMSSISIDIRRRRRRVIHTCVFDQHTTLHRCVTMRSDAATAESKLGGLNATRGRQAGRLCQLIQLALYLCHRHHISLTTTEQTRIDRPTKCYHVPCLHHYMI